MQASPILAALLVATAIIAVDGGVAPSGYEIDPKYHQKVTFECANGKFLTGLRSRHVNELEDRLWKFGCGENLGRFTSCTWTSWINGYDGELTYRCPEHSFFAGYESIYSTWHKDRRTQLRCCTNGRSKQRNCYWTDWVNDWDGLLEFILPANSGKALAGWHSVHHNWFEDRRHKFLVCSY